VLFLEQTIEHAPGEGAVRAAALQGQIDLEMTSETRQAVMLRSLFRICED
jgi:hypothetical protein